LSMPEEKKYRPCKPSFVTQRKVSPRIFGETILREARGRLTPRDRRGEYAAVAIVLNSEFFTVLQLHFPPRHQLPRSIKLHLRLRLKNFRPIWHRHPRKDSGGVFVEFHKNLVCLALLGRCDFKQNGSQLPSPRKIDILLPIPLLICLP